MRGPSTACSCADCWNRRGLLELRRRLLRARQARTLVPGNQLGCDSVSTRIEIARVKVHLMPKYERPRVDLARHINLGRRVESLIRWHAVQHACRYHLEAEQLEVGHAVPRDDLASRVKHGRTVLGLTVGSKRIQRGTSLLGIALVHQDQRLVFGEGGVDFFEAVGAEKVVLGEKNEHALRRGDILLEVADLPLRADECSRMHIVETGIREKTILFDLDFKLSFVFSISLSSSSSLSTSSSSLSCIC